MERVSECVFALCTAAIEGVDAVMASHRLRWVRIFFIPGHVKTKRKACLGGEKKDKDTPFEDVVGVDLRADSGIDEFVQFRERTCHADALV
jgi:hypothetical protein